MIDPFLSDLMNVIVPKKSNVKSNEQSTSHSTEIDRDQLAFDEMVKGEVDRLMAIEDVSANQLLPPEARRAKIEREVRAAADMSEYGKYMSLANKIMINEGTNYLEQHEHNDLLENLNKQKINLDSLDLKEITQEKLRAVLKMSVENRTSILKIGITKFSQGLLEDCIAIFTFLTAIADEEPDYWYRLGLVAQKAGNWPLAINALNTAADLAPEFIGARLYKAECFLNNGMPNEAHAELNEAKEILKTTNEEDQWQEHVLEVEDLLAKVITGGRS